MSEDVDCFIDSDSFSDQKLIEMLQRGKKVSSLSLVRYLSRGIVSTSEMYTPKKEVVKELLDAGAEPFHFEQRRDWEVIFQNDIRAHMPVPLRSTINLAALIRDRSVMDLLFKAGEKLNDYTVRFLEAV